MVHIFRPTLQIGKGIPFVLGASRVLYTRATTYSDHGTRSPPMEVDSEQILLCEILLSGHIRGFSAKSCYQTTFQAAPGRSFGRTGSPLRCASSTGSLIRTSVGPLTTCTPRPSAPHFMPPLLPEHRDDTPPAALLSVSHKLGSRCLPGSACLACRLTMILPFWTGGTLLNSAPRRPCARPRIHCLAHPMDDLETP